MRPWISLKRAVAGGAVLVFLATLLAWLCFQHVPAWYRPLWLTHTEVEAVGREAQQAFELISQKMAGGRAFSVTLDDRQINRMLAARRVIWPASTDWLPADLRTPCVALAGEQVMVGLRWRRGEVQSILSAAVRLSADDQHLAIALGSARAGALPLPLAALRRLRGRPAEAAPGATRSGSQIGADLLHARPAAAVSNEFVWPNGKIRFRVTDIAVDGSTLRVRVCPQP